MTSVSACKNLEIHGHADEVPSAELVANAADRATLERWIRTPTLPQRTVLRSRIVLLLLDGHSAREVGRRLGISRHTVDLWRIRYSTGGCDALTHDRPGRGRKRSSVSTTSGCQLSAPRESSSNTVRNEHRERA
jgi:hypothetical protein